jgi:outer membrane receptor for ferrienterochelin and colicin
MPTIQPESRWKLTLGPNALVLRTLTDSLHVETLRCTFSLGWEARSEISPLGFPSTYLLRVAIWRNRILFHLGGGALNSSPKRYRTRSASRWVGPTCALILILIGIATASAQTLKTSGTLEGTVSDATGGRIPGVKVNLRQTDTNQTRVVYTDDQGFFRSTDLPVGSYEVRIENPGFAPYLHTGVDLDVGITAHLDVVLPAASVQTQVTVSAQPSPIDPTQTSVTSSVDRQRIEDLPVDSRNSLDFVLAMPGVTSSSSQQGGTGSHRALADSGFTFGGLRPRSNNVSVDGLDNNDEYTGSSRTELSPEEVQEYQVVNNGLSAEYGGASGGSINVVTRTGANVIRGDAFLYAQNGVFNAQDPLETTPGKPDFRRYRIGSSMGGPIVKNRVFFHAAFEQESNIGQIGSDVNPSLASAINNFLATGAFPRLNIRQITTGFDPIARAETEASGKVNYQISSRNSLTLRYAFTNNRVAGNAFNTTALDDASVRGSSFTADNVVAGSLVTVYGSGSVGDLRFQAATRHAVLRTNDSADPEIDINGLVDFGQPYAGNSSRRENHYQASYTYLKTKGQHLWKVGGTVNDVSLRATVLDGFGGLYLFGSLADFMAGNADQFRQTFGNPNVNYSVTSFGGFVQDHWSIARKLTLDLGIRYDYERLPSLFNQDTNNFSPRIGLAWSPSSKWVVRAGYGTFFDRYVLASLTRAIEFNGSQGFEQVIDGSAAASAFAGAGGGSQIASISGVAPSIYQPDPHMATPYSQQANAGAEYLLAKDVTFRADYLFVRGVKLSRTLNVNLLPPVVLTLANAASLGITNPTPQQIGNEVFTSNRQNPAFDDIYQIQDSASSTYNGVSFTLNRRLSNDVEFSGSYTLSKTLDDASDFDEQPQNPFDLAAEHALSRQNQQQRFVFNALWNLPIPGQIELAPLITLGTGRPINPLVGLNSNRNDAFPLSARPLGLGRNSLLTPGMAIVDLGVVKTINLGEHRHLDLITQFFNLFNHTSAAAINPFFGTGNIPLPGYGQSIQDFSPRIIQFAANFEY